MPNREIYRRADGRFRVVGWEQPRRRLVVTFEVVEEVKP